MTTLKERFSRLCQNIRARMATRPVAPPPQMPEPPAGDLLRRGAGQIHKIGKPLDWKSP